MALIHTSMAGTARAMARVSAMPDYAFVTVDYPHVPLGVWTPEEVRAMARETAAAVIAGLTT